MTHIRFDALAASAFRNATAQLPIGLWVVLAHRNDAAAEFTRLLSGVQKPAAGRVWFDARAPYSNPAVRRSLAAVLPQENFEFATTVRRALESVAIYKGVALKPEAVLEPLELQDLVNRKTTRLTPLEARQISMALAMAQVDSQFAVFYEPLLALRESQVRLFQDWLSDTSKRACIVCVTSSSYDAQLLGGPQAQLTRRGWEPAALTMSNSTSRSVFLEGKNVRDLASTLALETRFQVIHLSRSTRADCLHVYGTSSDVSTHQILAQARRTGATVTRLWTEVTSATSMWETATNTSAEPEVRMPPRPSSANSTIRGLMDEARLATRPLLTPLGAASLALVPCLAWAYGSLKHTGDRGWAAYDTLVFTGTILTPLWSLWITRQLRLSRLAGDDQQAVSRFGVSRRITALARLLTGSTIGCLLSAIAAVFGLIGASSGRALAPAISELYQSSWILGLAGAVYGSIALFLSAFKRGRLLCWAFILLDFALGGGGREVSFPFPRAHIHNLLGSPSSIQFLQRGSCVYLASLVVLAIGLTLVKTEA